MVIRVVRFGAPRHESEGPRIGTVCRLRCGVPKSKFAAGNWYDVWFPNPAPRVKTSKFGHPATTPAQWSAFIRNDRFDGLLESRQEAVHNAFCRP